MAKAKNAHAAADNNSMMNSNGTATYNKQPESNFEAEYNIIANSGWKQLLAFSHVHFSGPVCGFGTWFLLSQAKKCQFTTEMQIKDFVVCLVIFLVIYKIFGLHNCFTI